MVECRTNKFLHGGVRFWLWAVNFSHLLASCDNCSKYFREIIAVIVLEQGVQCQVHVTVNLNVLNMALAQWQTIWCQCLWVWHLWSLFKVTEKFKLEVSIAGYPRIVSERTVDQNLGCLRICSVHWSNFESPELCRQTNLSFQKFYRSPRIFILSLILPSASFRGPRNWRVDTLSK